MDSIKKWLQTLGLFVDVDNCFQSSIRYVIGNIPRFGISGLRWKDGFFSCSKDSNPSSSLRFLSMMPYAVKHHFREHVFTISQGFQGRDPEYARWKQCESDETVEALGRKSCSYSQSWSEPFATKTQREVPNDLVHPQGHHFLEDIYLGCSFRIFYEQILPLKSSPSYTERQISLKKLFSPAI